MFRMMIYVINLKTLIAVPDDSVGTAGCQNWSRHCQLYAELFGTANATECNALEHPWCTSAIYHQLVL
jgi:hypothetical protein